MSSVSFEKIKQNSKPVSAYIRHNDSSERLKHEHSNKDINKDLTSGNVDWKGIDYNAAQERYKARIAELDKVEGQNKRKDRVVAFALCVPIPKDVSDKKAFFNDVIELFSKDFGERNIIQGNLHVDEVHDYIENGEVKTSLEHIHCLVIPEINGKLCGKKFSSRAAMSGLSKEIDNLCKTRYHCNFLTGEPPQHKTVEELKAEGEAEKKALLQLADTDIVETKRKGFTDVVLSKKEYEKLTLQAERYKQIEEKNEEIKDNANKVKEAHKALQADLKVSKSIIEQADNVKKIAKMLPFMEQKKRFLDDEIDIATDELNALNKAKEQYGDSLRNQAKYAKIEAENNALKQALNSIRQAIQREIQALEKINHPIAAKVKKSLERLINKNESQRDTDINGTER